MEYKQFFKRYELKYMLTREQRERITRALSDYMQLDKYGRCEIRNIYFDTPSYRLIRRSIEKPTYKEKLRIRSYGPALSSSPVFVELKKKYKSVVYKRRVAMSLSDAEKWIYSGGCPPTDCQITREIDYFRNYYAPLSPTVFLSYEREAYYSDQYPDFRVTFDDNVIARREELLLSSEGYGSPLIDGERSLMEIKCAGGMPLFMTEILFALALAAAAFAAHFQNTEKPTVS